MNPGQNSDGAAFDHRDTGTAEASWAPLLQGVAHVSACQRPLVVLAAHPDDETLGAGGLITASARAGAAVTVLVASDGEASHPLSPTHTPARLAEIRRAEVTAAVAQLAPQATVRWLGLPDGRLADYPGALDAALRTFVTSADVRVVAPYRADGHPDHEACARSAARVAQATQAELWEYPIWFWHWGDPTGDDLPRSRCRILPLTDADREAKAAALAEYRSQHAALSPRPGDEAILTPAVLSHFDRPFECFVAAPAASRGAYFDALYAGSEDPWGLDERFYERRKREVLLAALPRWRFRRSFEPGCATGALTARLAERTDELVAWDLADAARENARRRLEAYDNVSVEAGRIPEQWPPGHFELIVLSEVGYYCEDLELLAARVRDSLTDDGVLLACHWRRDAADHPHRAEEVHAAVGAGLHRLVHHTEGDFVLDVWSRVGRSVAETDGIA